MNYNNIATNTKSNNKDKFINDLKKEKNILNNMINRLRIINKRQKDLINELREENKRLCLVYAEHLGRTDLSNGRLTPPQSVSRQVSYEIESQNKHINRETVEPDKVIQNIVNNLENSGTPIEPIEPLQIYRNNSEPNINLEINHSLELSSQNSLNITNVNYSNSNIILNYIPLENNSLANNNKCDLEFAKDLQKELNRNSSRKRKKIFNNLNEIKIANKFGKYGVGRKPVAYTRKRKNPERVLVKKGGNEKKNQIRRKNMRKMLY